MLVRLFEKKIELNVQPQACIFRILDCDFHIVELCVTGVWFNYRRDIITLPLGQSTIDVSVSSLGTASLSDMWFFSGST